jgi:hypothetical protein
MIVSAWNNGAHNRNGTGYGFKVNLPDRDQYFKKDWEKIVIEIEDGKETFEIAINKTQFWGEEPYPLISKEIGKWLRNHGLAPWPHGKPPVFALDPVSDNQFSVNLARTKKSAIS